MTEYTHCSRCNAEIESCAGEGSTCGYYELVDFWKQFANEGELYLCDACMFAEPKYIAIYGRNLSTFA